MVDTNLLATVDAFLAHMARDKGYAATTVASYRGDLTAACAYVAEAGAPCDLGAVTSEALRDFLRQPMAGGAARSPRSRNRRLAALRAFCAWAKDRGLRRDDPTTGIPWSVVRPRDPPSFAEHDLRRIVDAARAHPRQWHAVRDEAILVLLAQSGLRLREVVGLDIGQVVLDEARLRRVRRKGGALRDLVINAEVVRVLVAWLRVRGERTVADEPALFLSREQRRLSPRMVQVLVARYADQAGIAERVTPHVFRHTHCYLLQRHGAPMRVAQELLAHARIETTALYSRATEADQRAALSRLEGITRPAEVSQHA